jgi:hypothetical protein
MKEPFIYQFKFFLPSPKKLYILTLYTSFLLEKNKERVASSQYVR